MNQAINKVGGGVTDIMEMLSRPHGWAYPFWTLRKPGKRARNLARKAGAK